MRTYHQLTQAQRYQIYALRKTKHTLTEIAQVIGVHKSSKVANSNAIEANEAIAHNKPMKSP